MSRPTYHRKLDLKRELKHQYRGKVDEVKRIEANSHPFLCCHGRGDPNTSEVYKAAVETLFSLSYFLKFQFGKKQGRDYVVMPLEGLWWSDDFSVFERGDRARWNWTMMIMQPAFIEVGHLEDAKIQVQKKRGTPLATVTLEHYHEGPSVQLLHVGPFDKEGPAIQRMHQWISDSGHALDGKHHEIYLTDIRRVESARWKTLLRQPFR